MTTTHEHLEHRLEKKAVHRTRKRLPKMVVSGKSVFTLRRLLTTKTSKKNRQ